VRQRSEMTAKIAPNRRGPILARRGYQGMGHITADDAKWLVSIAIFAVLVWSVAFLVLAVLPGNARGARQRKADRQGKQKRALSPLAFVAMVFPSLVVIVWYALPRHVRRQALEGVNFGAATNNAIGIGREVRALLGRLFRVTHP
jgi:heme/copper-type cytochrome/quinol oxidase subunit 2